MSQAPKDTLVRQATVEEAAMNHHNTLTLKLVRRKHNTGREPPATNHTTPEAQETQDFIWELRNLSGRERESEVSADRHSSSPQTCGQGCYIKDWILWKFSSDSREMKPTGRTWSARQSTPQ